jgi:hypothetical protein
LTGNEYLKEIEATISAVLSESLEVRLSESFSKKAVVVNRRQGRVTIYEDSPILPSRLSVRRLVQKIVCFYELSRAFGKDAQDADLLFTNFLTQTKY